MPVRHIDWPQAWRIIASRYPPIALFERLTADTAVWDALIALEQLTNPRVRDEVGEVALVLPAERIAGPGASWVMAAFTHLNRKGSRFSDGTFGVYYAAAELETAIAETVYHFEAFARDSNDPPRMEDMRVLVGSVSEDFEDVAALAEPQRSRMLDPDSYAESQAYARQLRDNGAAGIVYPSVRWPAGTCIGAFRPRAVSIPRQERHLKYRWNGEQVDRYFDYQRDIWVALTPMPPVRPAPQPTAQAYKEARRQLASPRS
nr:RES family NAD+ phosphorylase [uncultured Rhodopila sp.]